MTGLQWIVGIGAVLALALLIRGWRGKRVGDHPHCRRCGFDLYGSPGATTCPECGCALTRSGDRVRGLKQRRRTSLVAGIILLVVLAPFAALNVWQYASRAHFYAQVPSQYLLWQIDDPLALKELRNRLKNQQLSQPAADRLVRHVVRTRASDRRLWNDTWQRIIRPAHNQGYLSQRAMARYARRVVRDRIARQELNRRLRLSQLNPQVAQALVKEALTVQADQSRTWRDSWGQIIEHAHQRGILTQTQLKQYLRQAVSIKLNLKHPQPVVGQDPGLHIDAEINDRQGRNTVLSGSVGVERLVINGSRINLDYYKDYYYPLRREATVFRAEREPPVAARRLPMLPAVQHAGPLRVAVVARMSLQARIGGGGHGSSNTIQLPPQRMTTQLTVKEGSTESGKLLVTNKAQRDRAGLWIERGPKQNQGSWLVFSAVNQPRRMGYQRYIGWLRTDKGLQRLPPPDVRVMPDRGVYHLRYRWPLGDVRDKIPGERPATQVDVLLRADTKLTKSQSPIQPVWRGQWIFTELPLDSEPVVSRWPSVGMASSTSDLATLVRPTVTTLSRAQTRPPLSDERNSVSTTKE